MVKFRPVLALEILPLLPEKSFAYRRQRSTSACLNHLLLHIVIEKSYKKHALGLSQDIIKPT